MSKIEQIAAEVNQITLNTIVNQSICDNFIIHTTQESWGFTVMIMEKRGIAFCRLYCYNDDSTTAYLDMLDVDVKYRRQGLGTKLQKMREEIAINLKCKNTCLWVESETWMIDWYKRRGYSYYSDYKDDSGYIKNAVWMKKELL